MKSRIVMLSMTMALAISTTAGAQQPEMPKPQKEHELLKKFVGQWESEMDAVMAPGQDPVKLKTTLSCRMLGGFWVINEMKGDMMGMPVTGIQTIGYDAENKKYVGTWVDSATSFMWHYEGTVADGGKKLILAAEGPNPMLEGKTTQFKDTYEFTSDKEMKMTSSMLGEDGKWIDFMTGTAKRVK